MRFLVHNQDLKQNKQWSRTLGEVTRQGTDACWVKDEQDLCWVKDEQDLCWVKDE